MSSKTWEQLEKEVDDQLTFNAVDFTGYDLEWLAQQPQEKLNELAKDNMRQYFNIGSIIAKGRKLTGG